MNALTNFVDAVTKLPGQISERSDRLNDKLISFSRDLQRAIDNSATTAETNLTQNKIRSLGSDGAQFIARNLTPVLIGVGVLVLILFLRK